MIGLCKPLVSCSHTLVCVSEFLLVMFRVINHLCWHDLCFPTKAVLPGLLWRVAVNHTCPPSGANYLSDDLHPPPQHTENTTLNHHQFCVFDG